MGRTYITSSELEEYELKIKKAAYKRGAHAMRCAVVMWLQDLFLEAAGNEPLACRLKLADLREMAGRLELPEAEEGTL